MELQELLLRSIKYPLRFWKEQQARPRTRVRWMIHVGFRCGYVQPSY